MIKKCPNLDCPECDNQMLRKKVPYEFKGKQFGEYEAYVCEKCNTTYFTEKSFQEIEDKAKELGVWGEEMKIIEEVEEYENPFFGERYFGHEDCYEEFEKFRKRVLEIVRGI